MAGTAAPVRPVPLAGVAVMLAFAAAGVVLLAVARAEDNARALGLTFLLTASVFSDVPVLALADQSGIGRGWLRGMAALQVDALTPYFLWRFVALFPRPLVAEHAQRRAALATRLSLHVGGWLLAANFALFCIQQFAADSPLRDVLWRASRHAHPGLYWASVTALMGAALGVLVARARRARGDDARRSRLLVAGIAAGTLPTVLYLLAQVLWPPFGRLVPIGVAGWVVYPTLLATPFAVAYAVLVRRALDVRVVVRRALQYAMARSVATAAVAIPLALLPVALYQNRDRRLGDLMTAPGGLALAATAGFGLLALRYRGHVLGAVDRRFFREQYDARRILGQLVDRCGGAASRRELAAVLETEIDRALHVDPVRVLYLDLAARAFVPADGDGVPPLPAGAALVALAAARGAPLDVDLAHPDPTLRDLPEPERQWAADAGVRLLLPLRDAARRPVALVALGAKRSELPFSPEDRALLAAAAAAAEMAITHHDLASSPGHVPSGSGAGRHTTAPPAAPAPAEAAEESAAECVRCGAVQPPERTACARCGGPTVECLLPQLVGGKFLIDERIGSGGMGVVYRGMDVHLGRLVAVKTLPALLPDDAVRLRREARTMAAVTHPNLALLFGAETWQGRPMLVVEYLAGGTLAARLSRRPLAADAAVALGLALAAGLDAVHTAGVLHGDVKPSNIGFAADGTPKLLDFGLARLLPALGPAPQHAHGTMAGSSAAAPWSGGGWTAASSSVLRGTPRYMSPEARLGAGPSPAFDLWSTCLTLYEAVAGPHVWADAPGGAPPSAPTLPDVRTFAPDVPAALATFFRRALSPAPAERPRTAAELAERLRPLVPPSGPATPAHATGPRIRRG